MRFTPTGFIVRTASLVIITLLAACDRSTDATEHLQNAIQLRKEGELRASWIEARNAVVKDQSLAEARLLMGELQLDVGRPLDAQKEFDRAESLGIERTRLITPLARVQFLQRDGEKLEPLVAEGLAAKLSNNEKAQLLALKGQLLYTAAKYPESSEVITQAIELDPDCPDAVLTKASLAVVNNEVYSAEGLLQNFLKKNPRFAPAWSLLGDIYRVQKELEAAIEAYTKSIEIYSFGIQDLSKRAVAYLHQGNFEAALKDAETLNQRAPTNPSADYVKGLVALSKADFITARDLLTSALNKSSSFVPAKLYLAQARTALGEYQQAENELADVIASLPGSRLARIQLGVLRMRRADFAGVLDAVKPILEKDNNDAEALELVGSAELMAGRSEAGLAMLERATKINPESPSTKTTLSLGLLASGEAERGIVGLQEVIAAVPESPNMRAQLVAMFLRIRDFARAREAVARFRKEQPDDLTNLQLEALVERADGKLDAAYSILEKLVQIYPSDPSSNHTLAAIDIERKDFAKARERYETVLKGDPLHERTVTKLAELESREGQLAASKARLEEFLRARPDSLIARRMLAQFFLGSGEPLKAQQILAEVQEQYSKDASLLLLLARAHAGLGEPGKAAELLERVVSLAPGDLPARMELAQTYAMAGENEKSIQAVNRVLQMDPNFVPALVARFRTYALAGNIAEASTIIDSLAQKFPDSPEVKAQLAWFKSAIKKEAGPAEALSELRSVFDKDPSSTLARKLANQYTQQDQPEAAIEVLKKWLQQAPNDVRSRELLGVLQGGNGDSQGAVAALQAVLEAEPGNIAALNNLAWFMTDINPKAAVPLAERASNSKPGDPVYADTLARALLQSGDKAGSIGVLRKAIVQNDNAVELRLSLAKLFLKDGNQTEARALIDEVLAKQPEHAGAKALLDTL